MEEKKIVAAPPALSCHSNLPKNTGNDYPNEVMQTDEYFFKRLAEIEAASIPEALKGMVDNVRKTQEEREEASGDYYRRASGILAEGLSSTTRADVEVHYGPESGTPSSSPN